MGPPQSLATLPASPLMTAADLTQPELSLHRLSQFPLSAFSFIHLSVALQVHRLHRKLERFHVSDYNALRRAYRSLAQHVTALEEEVVVLLLIWLARYFEFFVIWGGTGVEPVTV